MPRSKLTMYEISQLLGSPENRKKIMMQFPGNPAVRFFIALNTQHKKTLVEVADSVAVIIPSQKTREEFYNDIQEGLFEPDEKEILAHELGITAAAIWVHATDEHGQTRR